MDLKDKVIVITGASQGFGAALAKAFIEQGAKVIISSDDKTKLAKTAKTLGCDQYPADVVSYYQVVALADHARHKYGRIDIWINNAGVQIAPSLTEDVDIAKLRKLLNINFYGYFYGCKAVLPIFKAQNYGTIININSTAGLDGKPGLSAYVSSKWAIKGLTLTIREELKGSNVQIHGVHPGGMQTDIYHEQVPDDFNDYMTTDYAVDHIIDNLTSPSPVLDLIIRRPSA